MFRIPNASAPVSRRAVLRSLAAGSIMMPGILQALLADESRAALAPSAGVNPLAPRMPPFPARAKRVIFMNMSGGVSHLDTFDPKPQLIADAGKIPGGKGKPYLRPGWNFSPGGSCGTPVSDLFPNIRQCMDDICLIRSMHGDHGDHFQATLGIHTGSVTFARPSLGSWVSYGLGTVNQNLPSFVVLAPFLPYAGSQVWSSNFLPGCHQGTRVLAGAEPIPDLNRTAPSLEVQEMELNLLAQFNKKHQQPRANDPALAARIKSFETAFGMQMAMPDVLDLKGETDATHNLYGLERGSTKGFAWQCLIARRLIERGVRFVELIDTGSNNNWDSHSDMKLHGPLAKNVDRPIAGLLKDLKSRGMLEDTLVVWTTEFGRTPQCDGPTGRGHHAPCYSSWMAGAGVKGGIIYGASDDHGHLPVENPVHVHDFHATILALLGFDHTKLTYRHAGRDFRLTDVAGTVVKGILA
ncbi:MAG TPA: DUF1501 domain-containing protein [Tepidisphaeraceae bacterium]|jgi:hypothetical protein|nr:DUF1501 domain-containing protein [Tepidisphaeraceae bacterium]